MKKLLILLPILFAASCTTSGKLDWDSNFGGSGADNEMVSDEDVVHSMC